MKYRKIPLEVEAIQFWPQDEKEIQAFLRGSSVIYTHVKAKLDKIEISDQKYIPRTITIWPSEWIIKGSCGDFYGCKPDLFPKLFERVK